MNRIPMFIKIFFATGLLFFTSELLADVSKAIIKANIIRGESMVTAKIDSKVAESVIEKELNKRGISRVYSQESENEGLLIVEVFIYQFPANNPNAILVARSREGIHYIKNEVAKVFVKREDACISLVKHLSAKLPDQFDLTKIYKVNIPDFFSRNTSSIIETTNNLITESYRFKYLFELNWPASPPLIFLSQINSMIICVTVSIFKELETK